MHKTIDEQAHLAQIGLVISYFGSSVAVEAENGQVFQCHIRRNQELPVVGDRVYWEEGVGKAGTIISIAPRRSLLTRGKSHGKTKPIAANIDTIVIVMSPPPIFSEYLIDRYLIAAELLNINPVLVLNKTDLLTEENRSNILDRLHPYQKISYSVILSSIFAVDGLHELGLELKNKMAVLVGPSGVGKSSIIAAFRRDENIRVGEVSSKGIGKHTTTATRLYHLLQGGSVIDSPGVREFNLWAISQKDVLLGFKEFSAYQYDCKFRDCLHLVEPGCAVQAAVTNGKISPQRLKSYQELMKEAYLHKNHY